MSFRLLTLLFLLQSSLLWAQNAEDTLIVAQGKIYHSVTKEPVKAKVTYQSLPYGNVIGVINNTSYSFPMFDKESYSILIEAQGFKPAKFLLNPIEADSQNHVTKDIPLEEGVAEVQKIPEVFTLNNLIFEAGKYKISPESYEELDRVVTMMETNPRMVIQLEGHTDTQGIAKDNLTLSERRVLAVKEYLVRKNVAKARVKTKAFGGSQPKNTANTPEAHRMNRRVELRVLKN